MPKHAATHCPWASAVLAVPIVALGLLQGAATAQAQPVDLIALSIEELGQLRVTSVFRQPEPVAEAPASIYVLTGDDLRRAGVTSLAEALRLAPSLQVARLDSVQYAISARGFNNAIGNKLLVLIDGRTIYTPLFSGVFWDQQDVLLEDIDRIEVITGPGATLWGANAVNGVINIVTKSSSATRGLFLRAGGGNRERRAAFRFGNALGASGTFRVYAKAAELAETRRTNGAPALDEWTHAQAGMRADWELERDRFTLQADIYDGESQDRGTFFGVDFGEITVAGANVLGRWIRSIGESQLQVQTFFDHTERDDVLFFRPHADTFDVELQHAIPFRMHEFLWGGGYRRSQDTVDTGFTTTFIPRSRELDWWNVFVHDRLELTPSFELTIGVKLEHNDYTGRETLPSTRIAWRPGDARLVWAARSRAVRAPSRFDRDVFFPGTPPFFVIGGPNFVSEVADVTDIGYRAEPSPNFSYSVTAFRHDWDKLRSGSSLPVELENKIEGKVYGLEASLAWRVAPTWRLRIGGLRLEKDLRLEPGSTDPVGVDNETLANDPEYQWLVRATGDIASNFELDVRVRGVDDLPNPAVPSYTAVDASLGWHVRDRITLRATVTSAFDALHAEYGPAPTRSEQDRGFYLSVTRRTADPAP